MGLHFREMPGSMLVSVSVYPTHPTSRFFERSDTTWTSRWSVGIWLRLGCVFIKRERATRRVARSGARSRPCPNTSSCQDRPGVVKFSLLLSLLGRVAVRLAGGWRSAIQLNTIGPD